MPPEPHSELRGVYPVFQTPFAADESIDFAVLGVEIEWLFEQGVDGIVMAMVSEVLRLSTDERMRLAEAACDLGLPHGGVIVSVGAESTHSAVELARHAEAAGATAVMAIPPISVPLFESEVLRYYEALLDAIDVPVVVQDASGYVGRPMSIDVQADLWQRFGNRVMYKPEAEPVGPRLTELLQATAGRALVFEGSGGVDLVDNHGRGVVGTMPGADLCWAIVALWKALEEGNTTRVDAIHRPLSALIGLQPSLDAFLAIEKHLLHRQGVFPNTIVRKPVGFVLDPGTTAEVDRLFDLLSRVVAQSD